MMPHCVLIVAWCFPPQAPIQQLNTSRMKPKGLEQLSAERAYTVPLKNMEMDHPLFLEEHVFFPCFSPGSLA